MRKFGLFFMMATSAVALLLPSCVADEVTNDVIPSAAKVFRATTENATRTTLDENYKVLWSEGDKIRIIGTNDGQYEYFEESLLDGAGTTTGVFSNSFTTDWQCYFACYPASKVAGAWLNNLWAITLPKAAVFTQDNFVDNANPMVAFGDNSNELKFYNILGIVEFQISGGENRSISTIEVATNENKALAGRFLVDAATLEITPDEGGTYRVVSASLETPIDFALTPDKPKYSVYALLPPGTYSNLTVRLTDDIGGISVYTAKNDITVTRGHITPVSQMTYSEANIPYATVALVPEECNYEKMKIVFNRNTYGNSAGLYYYSDTKAQYEADLANYGSDLDILLHYNKKFTGTFATLTSYHYGSSIDKVALSAAYDSDGVIHQVVKKLEYTTIPVSVTDAYSVEPSGEQPEIGENSLNFPVTINGLDSGRIFYRICSDEELVSFIDANYSLQYISTTDAYAAIDSSAYIISIPNLTPDTHYNLLYTVSSAKPIIGFSSLFDSYAKVRQYDFTTVAHVNSAATVSFTATEVADWTATITAQVSAGTTEIAYYLTTDISGDSVTGDTVAMYGNRINVDNTTTLSLSFNDLEEDTTYYLYGVAYDEAGIYGECSAPIMFTTLSLIPVSDAGYTEFLGEYTMSILNSAWDDTSRAVTISQGVEGKTFLIDGLLYAPRAAAYGGVGAIKAKYKDGQICISPQMITPNIKVYAYCGSYMWYNPALCLASAYNSGLVMPKTETDGMIWNGFLFQDATTNNYLDGFTDMMLVKNGATIPIIGTYYMSDTQYGYTNTFKVEKYGYDAGVYSVSNFCLDGIDDIKWYATYDDVANTFTLDGRVVGYEEYGSFFGRYGFTTYGDYYPVWFVTGSTGEEVCDFAVDADTKKISALTANQVAVGAVDSNGYYQGTLAIFQADTTSVTYLDDAASSAAGKAVENKSIEPKMISKTIPFSNALKFIQPSNKTQKSVVKPVDFKDYADIIGR